jgi:hypothetical protein
VLLLHLALAAAQDAQREHARRHRGRRRKGDLDADQPLARPVDVLEIQQQRGLVEGEPDSDAERNREGLAQLGVVGEQRGAAGREREEDPRDEVVDVPAACARRAS